MSAKPICTDDAGLGPLALAIIAMVLLGIGLPVSGTVSGVLMGAVIKSGLLGASIPVAPLLAAILVAIILWMTILASYEVLCTWEASKPTCVAGVITALTPSFASVVDELFPWRATHSRADVVVKSDYWPRLAKDADGVHCDSDEEHSPLVYAYYRSDEACAGALGSVIGGAVGAVAGILVAAVVVAAIGCLTIIFCLLAILVAVLIAAAAVLIGAFLGGQAGKLAAQSDAEPSDDLGNTLRVGDYVSVTGMMTDGIRENWQFRDFHGARAFWFVEATALHGHTEASPPFSFQNPDVNLVSDACSRPSAPQPPTVSSGIH